MDTIKDHLKSKKHRQRKDLKEGDTSSSGRKQVTLTTLVKSKDLRDELVLDFIKMSTMVDIPLEKVERMRPFLLKYCKQAGTLPKASTLRSQYVPRAFEGHFIALKDLLKESAPALVHLSADETTDVRYQSILNILATIRGKSYLIGIVRLEACNHSTFSRAIMKCVAYRMSGYMLSLPIVLHIARRHIEKSCRHCFPEALMCHALHILST